MADNQHPPEESMDTGQLPAAHGSPLAGFPLPLIPPAVQDADPPTEDDTSHAPTNDEKVAVIKRMIERYLPELGVYISKVGELQFAPFMEENPTFGGRPAYREARFKIREAKELIGKLETMHQDVEDGPVEDPNFAFLKDQLSKNVETMRTTSRGFKKLINLQYKQTAVEILRQQVGIAELLLKQIREYLNALLAKFESDAVGGGGVNEFDGDYTDFHGNMGNGLYDGEDGYEDRQEEPRASRRTSNQNRRSGRNTRSKRSHPEDGLHLDGNTFSRSARSNIAASRVLTDEENDLKRRKTQRSVVPEPVSDSEMEPERRKRGRPPKNAKTNDLGERTLSPVVDHVRPSSSRQKRTQEPQEPTNLFARKVPMDDKAVNERNLRTVCMFLEGVSSEQITDEVSERIYGIAGVVREVFPKLEVHIDQIGESPDHVDYRRVSDWSSFQITPAPTPPPVNGSLDGFEIPNLTGELHCDINTVTSSQITQLVKESVEKGVNQVYTPPLKTVNFPKCDNQLYINELEFFEEKYGYKGHEGLVGSARLQAPATIITVSKDTDLNDPSFVKFVTESPLCVVRGMLDVVGFDRSKFTPSAILAAKEDVVVEVSRQHPEPTQCNSDLRTGKQLDIKADHGAKKFPLKEYVEYYTKAFDIAKAGAEKMSAPGATMENLIGIEKELLAAQKPLIPRNHKFDAKVLWTHFAINLDIDDLKYHAQIAEINKLMPAILSKHGLFWYTTAILKGLITAQIYTKTPGSRTPAHVENANFGSINANIGPGTCIWFIVAYEHAGQVTEIIEKNSREGEIVWPLEEVCRDAGIPIQTVHQLPGDVVHVAPGTFHWVVSLGFTTNVSWNVGQITNAQLQAAVIHHDRRLTYYQKSKEVFKYTDNEIMVPLEVMVWAMAKENEFGNDPAMAMTMKGIMIWSLARAEYGFLKLTDDEKRTIQELTVDEKTSMQRCKECNRILGNYMVSPRLQCYCLDHRPSNSSTAYHRKPISVLRDVFDKFSLAC